MGLAWRRIRKRMGIRRRISLQRRFSAPSVRRSGEGRPSQMLGLDGLWSLDSLDLVPPLGLVMSA